VDVMEDRATQCNGETSDNISRISSEDGRSRRSAWTNGQCILAVRSSSMLAPSFDLSFCRSLLERKGFQIPVEDFETPVGIALDPPSVRRYLFFNSSLFHFILAPINVNTDVRLVQVNERLVKHGLLLGVADWVQQCSGKMQLFCVFWDLSPCLQALTETLEEFGFVKDEIENKLKKRMSHIYIVTDVSDATEAVEGEPPEETDEEQPLLVETRPRSNSQKQRDESKLTRNYSLIPDCTRSYQAIAYQLLLTYSAVYVRLLVSERLPASSHRPLGTDRNHCTTASLCLCQYIQNKVLR
uniref:Transmembrane protein 268 n=1 Tax=Astyanax mexicanus TaxID=7994 RepID=W5KWC4_ASTMX